MVLAAQITTSAPAASLARSQSASTVLFSPENSDANRRKRSGLRAQSSNCRTRGARQRAHPEPTSPLAPITRTRISVSLRPKSSTARSIPRTMSATVRVLPVVKDMPGWSGRRSVLPSRRMELETAQSDNSGAFTNRALGGIANSSQVLA